VTEDAQEAMEKLLEELDLGAAPAAAYLSRGPLENLFAPGT
jgi:hypothetical protein